MLFLIIKKEPNFLLKLKFNLVLEKLHKQIVEKYKELNSQIQDLVLEYDLNQMIYSAKFNFEPVIGEIYHLYTRNTGENFLSLIEPKEWNQKYIGSFKLDSSQKWLRVDF